ncbi:MAG: DMT family transporter [Pseudomonadota bacterium]
MPDQAKGIFWSLVAGVLFVGVTGIVRHLGSDMNAVQSAFIRYVFGTLLFLPLYLQLMRARTYPRQIGLHVLRGLVHGVGVMLWFYAMARIPIAEVTAIGFSAPIFVTIGAAMFLGERLHARRITAVVFGFAGAIVILRPGVEAIQAGALAQLVAAPLFAISMIVAKQLSRTESSAAIVAYLSVFVALVLAPPAMMVWRTPTLEETFWLFLTAVVATAGHYALTLSFKYAELTVLQPFTFLQLVWATLLGYYVFAEVPDAFTWVGGILIVASASYIAHREAQLRERK